MLDFSLLATIQYPYFTGYLPQLVFGQNKTPLVTNFPVDFIHPTATLNNQVPNSTKDATADYVTLIFAHHLTKADH
jgi:hypothetical protein